MRSLLLVLLMGCGPEKRWDSPPIVTTASGIPVHIYSDGLVTDETVLKWVDIRAEEFIAHKADWGLDALADAAIWEAMRREPVIIYPFHALQNGKQGWNFYGSHIEMALDWPVMVPVINYDPPRTPILDSNLSSIGLVALPHEWKHTLLGSWHP